MLDKKRLAPVMRTVHERIAELFERGISETPEPLRTQLRRQAEAAREEAREMERTLEKLGPNLVS